MSGSDERWMNEETSLSFHKSPSPPASTPEKLVLQDDYTNSNTPLSYDGDSLQHDDQVAATLHNVTGDRSSLEGATSVGEGNNSAITGEDDISVTWSTTEQDAAPLKRMIGNGIMSPIAFRRDSYECWSAEKRMFLTDEVEHLEGQNNMRVAHEEHNKSPLKSLEYTGALACTDVEGAQDENEEPRVYTENIRASLSIEGGKKLSDGGRMSDEVQPAADLSRRSLSRILNDSAGSYNSVDIDSAKKKVDASSHAFLEHLRGAANRRNNQVIRCRDSLVAKQIKLKETTNAAVAAIGSSREEEPHSPVKREQPVNPFKAFKALPMPSASGGGLVGVPKVGKKPATTPFSPLLGSRRNQRAPLVSGAGGLVGVPKVDKKPTTTPFSPLLGARRPQKMVVASLKNRSSPMVSLDAVKRSLQKKLILPQQIETTTTTSEAKFKARPLPVRFSSQTGIPKVSKRPATIPVSPQLGFRRIDTITPSSRPSSRGSVSKSDTSISLVGLNLLSPAIDNTISNLENLRPARINHNMTTPDNQKIMTTAAYIPHSTIRAKARASYDRQRSVNEAARLKQTKRGWMREIKKKRAEIAKLRETL